MSEFESGFAYMRFRESVRTKFRFGHAPEAEEFLRVLAKTSADRVRTIPAGFPLYRAQLGTDYEERQIDETDSSIVLEEEVPYSPVRMKPRPYAAHEGRANPKGIPFLYLATDRETAMAEVRPWMGAQLSLGHFGTTKELQVVDFSAGGNADPKIAVFFGELNDDEVDKEIWAQVDRSFSEPVTDDPSTSEYVPTQIISERFRREGLDGVVYKSKLGDGFNVALFDLDSAELWTCSIFRTKAVSFQFSDEGRTYYVSKGAQPARTRSYII